MTPVDDRLAAVRCVAVDLDGVVYVGARAVPGAVEAVRDIRRLGLKLCFITNSSVQTRRQTVERLAGLGVDVAEEDVLTSAHAAGLVVGELARAMSHKPRVFVAGGDALREEVVAAGAECVRDDGAPCDFVVVGLDRDFSHETIVRALNAILRGAKLIACNRDARFPVEQGRYAPGCGPFVAAIECAAGRKADYEAGKPNTRMLELVARQYGLKPHEILMVGDSLESDIAMASRHGALSAWVNSTPDTKPFNKLDFPEINPTHVVASLADAASLIRDAQGGRKGLAHETD